MPENPGKPYLYYVGLEGVFVGNRWIQAPESLKGFDSAGNGGLAVDSGTTFTLFHRVEEFVLTLGKNRQRAGDVEEASGLGPCFYVEENNWMTSVPKLVLVFRGNASVDLPKESCFFRFGRRRSQAHVANSKNPGCFLMVGTTEGEDGDEEVSGPAGVLGNFQQQNVEVIFRFGEGQNWF
uniref:Peptidase A1 domain-containing protein n=1 Tax=Nymphaea colorata TaxID=210225 RepID=A0A5K0YLE1_9MAGN|nr:unnamed protein product [Nymphaea colorata]